MQDAYAINLLILLIIDILYIQESATVGIPYYFVPIMAKFILNRIVRLSIVFLSIVSYADSGVAGMTKYLRSIYSLFLVVKVKII